MKIKLNDTYTLNSDPFCVWITETVERQNGQGCYEKVFNGYHPTVHLCLLSFVRKAVNGSEVESILELAETIEQINRTIAEFCQSITVDIRKISAGK